ncbi:GNAT family N-acetyltransferase [Pseudoroseicyclus tamaricis]|uniref:Acetyltransferase n=1 Tax=Pseudoroseicyclus tamaricis TaxID=2705421 RepID=A0A6B2JHF2_9RHOB|nr:GNAT family N-acetyltransferase [Pseudoroseicyclus tamaricis]NDV00673.1 acetyltransferase [Pseudoroseicyclus tamaricis]
MAGPYSFRRVREEDRALLRRWLAEPHVRKWWGSDEPAERLELEGHVARWIVWLEGTPFAYMQDYSVHGEEGHHFAGLPAGSRGIDQYIGVPGLIGQGHGTGFIGARMQALYDEGAPAIAVDPDPTNARAIAVYRKLGFEVSGPAHDSRWGRVLPMVAWR